MDQENESRMNARSVRNIAASALTIAACLIAAAAGAGVDDAENAERVPVPASEERTRPFVSYGCYMCHGYLGQGGAAGPRLSPDLTYAAFQRFVRFPAGDMPAYPRELLSDADLRAIYSYVEALPPPTELEDLPLLYDTSR